MNKTAITLLTEQRAQEKELRRIQMIETFESLALKTDNEVAKKIYSNTVRLLKEGHQNV